MSEFKGSKARRLMIAGGLALFVGLPLLACSGSADTSTDGAVEPAPADGPKEGKAKAPKADIASALHAEYKVVPGDAALRQMKLINAGVEGKPIPPKLDNVTEDEKRLYNDAKKAAGPDKEYMRSQISMMKGARVTFRADGTGQYDFDGGKNLFKYTTSNVSSDALDIVITYDFGVVEKANLKMKGSDIAVHFTEPNVADFTFKQ
jgi:hypothetical protein